jgi:hypothetical protein
MKRFVIAHIGGTWAIWDTEERMVVDEDEDCDELLPVAAAMNSLNHQFHSNWLM